MAETYTDYFPTQLVQGMDCVICNGEMNFVLNYMHVGHQIFKVIDTIRDKDEQTGLFQITESFKN